MTRQFQPPHIYDNIVLDRATDKRCDALWLQAKRSDPESLVLVMCGLQFLIDETGERPSLMRQTVGAFGCPLGEEAAFLGLLGDMPLFAVDVGAQPEMSGARPVELREIGRFMNRGEAGILAFARALVHWHRNHRFCGACGEPTLIVQGGHARRCPRCERDVFPRIDPAIIVLVTHEDYCLLGRSGRFPSKMYSTLAGFVEPGESLEHCLRREVFEEAGVELADWHYRASQPWPFPQSLMLGFWATATDRRLNIDHNELEDALWIDRQTLKVSDDCPISLPNQDSIARALIEDWLDLDD